MADDYKSMLTLGGNISLNGKVPNAQAVGTYGKQVMDHYIQAGGGGNGSDPTFNGRNFNMLQLMNSLNAITDPANGGNNDQLKWTWLGYGGGSPQAVEFLDTADGTKRGGQCRILALVLRALAICPYPFGCGQGENDVKMITFNNERRGFVSNHAGTQHGLAPNVYDPNAPNNPVNLTNRYYWSNHVVLEYQNVFYDPSYKTTYNSLEAMAVDLIVEHTGYNKDYDNGRIEYTQFSAAGGPFYVETKIVFKDSPNTVERYIGPFNGGFDIDAGYGVLNADIQALS